MEVCGGGLAVDPHLHIHQITSSGLSACTIALLAFLKAGDHCLLPDSVYGPVRGFADGFLRRFGIDVEFYHASATVAELEGHFKPNTRVLYIESPGQSVGRCWCKCSTDKHSRGVNVHNLTRIRTP